MKLGDEIEQVALAATKGADYYFEKVSEEAAEETSEDETDEDETDEDESKDEDSDDKDSESDKDKKDDKDKKEETKAIDIELDRLDERVVRLTPMSSRLSGAVSTERNRSTWRPSF